MSDGAPLPRRSVSPDAATWVLCAAGVAACLVAPVSLGVVTNTDPPLLAIAVSAVCALATLPGALFERLVRWRVAWAWGAWITLALASTLASGRVTAAFYGAPGLMLGWLSLACLGALVLTGALRRGALREGIVAVAPWVVLGESIVSLVQVKVGPWPAGTFSNPTYFAMVVGMLLPLSAVVPDGASRLVRIARLLASGVGVVAIGASGSRVGFVAVLVWLVVALWSGALGGALASRTRRVALAVLLIVAVPAGVLAYLRGGADAGTFVSLRLAESAAALQGMLDRPLLGWGPDGYTYGAAMHVKPVMYEYAGTEFGQFGIDPHNSLAWIGVSTGILGLAIAAWMVFEVIRNWRRQARSGKLRPELVWAVGVYAFQALFAPMSLQTVLFPALALGASLAVEREAGAGRSVFGQGDRAAIAGRVLKVMLLLVAVVLLAYSASRIWVGDSSKSANLTKLEKTAAFWSDAYLWHLASVTRYKMGATQPALNAGRQDLTNIERALEIEPDNFVYRTGRASTLTYYGASRKEVEDAFGAVFEVFPTSPDAHAILAMYLIAQGDTAQAWSELEPLLEVGSPLAWRALGRYYEAIGDDAKAKTYLERKRAEFGPVVTGQ